MRRACLFTICLAWVFLAPGPAVSGDRVKTVRSEGKAELSADRTLEQTRNLAMEMARRNALEQALGLEVRGSTVVYNAEIINDMIMTATKGIIIGQEVIMHVCGEEEGKLYCTAEIKAKVKEIDRDPPFSIKAHVQRPDKKEKMDVAVFQEGDEVQVRVKLDKPAFLSIFSVDERSGLYPLYPNNYADAGLLEARKEFVFPDERQRAMGLKLRAHTLEGQSRSHESIMVVATRERVELLDEMQRAPTLNDLMHELAELDPGDWAQAVRGYVIMK